MLGVLKSGKKKKTTTKKHLSVHNRKEKLCFLLFFSFSFSSAEQYCV